MAWSYDRESRRYRNEDTGRYLSAKQMTELRDTFTDRMKERAANLAADLKAGAVDAFTWESKMRELAKAVHIDLAVLGRGGRSQMQPADWGRVGNALRGQYGYLGQFADATATLSEAQVAARAGLYVEAATTSYEKANAAAAGLPELPAYPGESSECLVSCRCSWEIEEVEGGWACTWAAAEDAATCPTCAERAQQWAPLFVAQAEMVAA